MAKKKKSAYAQAGVDIDEMMKGLGAIKKMVKATSTPDQVNDIGSFGGLFKSPGRDHLLVASTDGVGTKLMVAAQADRHDTVGQCLVNHCTNDILVQGARPLFFLDYLGTAKLAAGSFAQVVKGLTKACVENGCALLGGETAEMPGLYPPGEYDLVGTVVGAVKRSDVITGEKVRKGDVIIGLHSSGLHTNGYSLARRIAFDSAGLKITDKRPGSRRSIAAEFLAVHRSYLPSVHPLLGARTPVRGMAHITGGGLVDNVPRILPEGLGAEIDCASWKIPGLFSFLQEAGGVDPEEMFRVFNMGIGFAVIVSPRSADSVMKKLRAAGERPKRIGAIVDGEGVALQNLG